METDRAPRVEGRDVGVNQGLDISRVLPMSHLFLSLSSYFHMSAKMTHSSLPTPVETTSPTTGLLWDQSLCPGERGSVVVRPGSSAQSCAQKKGDGAKCAGQPKKTRRGSL